MHKCKQTEKEYKKRWYKANRERVLAARKLYYITHKEEAKAYDKKNRGRILARKKAYYYKNREKILAENRKYCRKHRRRLTEKEKMRFKTNIQFRLIKNLRRRTCAVIRGRYKSAPTLKLLGCSVDECKAYLESKFQPGMTWDNYGLYGWHIDHIIPCDAFDLSDPQQQKKCFHYTNLQPLWWRDNLSKGKKHASKN
jgi:hypothetical protein